MLSVRKVAPEDRALLDDAARADVYHARAGLTGEHWANGNTLMYADDSGLVVALRSTAVVRADIQFLTQDRRRNREALLEGFWRYCQVLRDKGFDEIIFNTDSVHVANFFKKRFLFRQIGPGTYSLRIKK